MTPLGALGECVLQPVQACALWGRTQQRCHAFHNTPAAHRQWAAMEFKGSRVYGWHCSLNQWPCLKWSSRKGGNKCQLHRSIFVHIYVKQRQLCIFVVTCTLLKSCCSQICHRLSKWLWKAGCRYFKTMQPDNAGKTAMQWSILPSTDLQWMN